MKKCCDVLYHSYVDPASTCRILPQIRPDPSRIHRIRAGSTKFTGYPAGSRSGAPLVLTLCDVLPEQADLAGRAASKAEEIGGSLRVISRSDGGQVTSEVTTVLRDTENNRAASVEEIMETLSGFVQAVFFVYLLCYFLSN